MNIIKCSCSRSIHIYTSDNDICPFCGNAIIKYNEINNSLNGALAFLNEKLLQIDAYIHAKQFKEALSLIDEVLEWMPGWKIGERIPQSGEVYWRKLLADAKCKSDVELLRHKGKLLQNFTAFNNAAKYANPNEKLIYASIEKAEKLIEEHLEKALTEHEIEEKRKTSIENKLDEYKQRKIELEALMQKNIAALGKLEKLIREQVIDCEVISNEYVFALDKLLTEAKKVNNHHNFEILKEEKNDWEAQLDAILLKSDTELHNLKKLEATQLETAHWRFLEHSLSLNDHKSILNEIRLNKDELDTLRSKTEQLVSSIEKIANEYADAREAVRCGNYTPASKLLSPACFDEIIKQAMLAST